VSQRVLVVDDDEDLLLVLKESLEDEGYEVTAVSVGREGLQALEGGEYCLALVDYFMADMPGDEFVRAARQRRPELPQVLLTGADEQIVRAAGIPVLRKPVAYDALMGILRAHCHPR
jgi:CheY-like chemotaxis protein